MNNPRPWWLTWPVAEVAAAILPLFSNAAALKEETAMAQILAWCGAAPYQPVGGSAWSQTRQKVDRRFHDPDARAIAEARHALDRAGLVMKTVGTLRPDPSHRPEETESFVVVGLTRLGMHALQTNTVRQHLGLGDTPPTA